MLSLDTLMKKLKNFNHILIIKFLNKIAMTSAVKKIQFYFFKINHR